MTLIDAYIQKDRYCLVLQGVIFKLTKTEANNLHTILGKLLDSDVNATNVHYVSFEND